MRLGTSRQEAGSRQAVGSCREVASREGDRSISKRVLQAATRRDFLWRSGCGFGALAMQVMLHEQAVRGMGFDPEVVGGNAAGPLAPKETHFPAKAKRVIFLFMSGGPSQVDLFDPKPELARLHGKELPYRLPDTEATVGLDQTRLLGPVSGIKQHGESGMAISEWLPHTAKHIDSLCVLRAMQADSPNHPTAIRQLHTGNLFDVVPSMGAWCSYGLGTENQELPSYITILPQEGDRNYSSAFLPAIHQGTAITEVGSGVGKAPIRHLLDPAVPKVVQRQRVDLLQAFNRHQLERVEGDLQMEGVIESFELAYRMQVNTPKLVDFSGETQESLSLYGIGEGKTDEFGRQCLLARRLSEAGVRFVQVSLGGWDHHSGIAGGLKDCCEVSDKPIAGLLSDLKQRGLLDETLVVWGGEFGRTPHAQNGDGREHNHHGFTMWMAGGGVKGGITHGVTDDFGYYGVEDRVHIHDLHATMLHLLGIDHERLTYAHHGRPFRLTDVAGRVVREIL